MLAATSDLRSAPSNKAIGMLVVLALHLLLLLCLARRADMPETRAAGPRTDIVFIQLAPKIIAPPPRAAPIVPVPKPAPAVKAPVAVRMPPVAPENTAPAEPILESRELLPENGLAENPAKIDAAELVRLAGKLDRQFRTPGEIRLDTTEGKSLRRKIDEGFAAARLAVPPRWYEAARIELFSAENDARKIYQIKTAFGTFCMYYPDKNSTSTASGAADFGQPKVASCPKRF
jgi:hypothetical protein